MQQKSRGDVTNRLFHVATSSYRHSRPYSLISTVAMGLRQRLPFFTASGSSPMRRDLNATSGKMKYDDSAPTNAKEEEYSSISSGGKEVRV